MYMNVYICDNFSPFRPILVHVLKFLSSNKYTVYVSFALATELVEQDSEFLTESLDVDRLFTDMPFEEHSGICPNRPFGNTKRVEYLLKIEFKELFYLLLQKILLYF